MTINELRLHDHNCRPFDLDNVHQDQPSSNAPYSGRVFKKLHFPKDMSHCHSKYVSLIFVSLTSFLRELLLCLRMREPLSSSTCFPFPRVIIIPRSKLVWVCNCVIQSFVHFWRSNLKYLQSPSSSHTNHCICIKAGVILVKDRFYYKSQQFWYIWRHIQGLI